AAILFLALTLLGCQNIALYDGSWAQWGAENALPCVCI
ncbi:sulfurtransferase, partial [Proteus mirabilis]